MSYSRFRKQQADEQRRRRHLAHITNWTATHPCVDCGEADPDKLQYDHIKDRRVRDVPRMAHYSMAKIKREIAKCEMRCGSCHAKITKVRRRADATTKKASAPTDPQMTFFSTLATEEE
jgi:hypothetical protein